MATANPQRLRTLLASVIGPTPWYWKTFPAPQLPSGEKLEWTYHGEQGPLAYLVSLASQQTPNSPKLALNSYCRPFEVPQQRFGIWCPEGRSIRVVCFDPASLQPFDFGEIAGWFKQSGERIYASTAPVAEFEIPLGLGPGTHKVEVPAELRDVDELIMPTSYPAKGEDDPSFALYVAYPQAGLVEVLPQRWFTSAQYDVGRKWITRAGRDTESKRIFGECFGVGSFLLKEDGCRLEEWIERKE